MKRASIDSRRLCYAPGRTARHVLVPTLLLLSLLSGCKSKTQSENGAPNPAPDALQLTFTYGSEKEKWINEVTDAFNRGDHRTSNGKRIFVHAFAMGSGEAIDEVMEGRRQPDIISPASAAFIKLGNAQSQSKYGRDLIAPTPKLFLSPRRICMWKPQAQRLRRGTKPLGRF